MKKLIENYKLQCIVILILTICFMFRAYFKTIGMMTVSNEYMRWISIFTILLGTMLVIATSYIMLIKKTRIEQIYPVIGFSLGLMFMLVIPVQATPDETYHFCGSYSISNKIMGIGYPEEEGRIYARKCDSEYKNTSFEIGVYQDFNETFKEDVDTSLVTMNDYSHGDASLGAYLIPALGITLGRLLHLNFPMTSMLGSLFNLIWFVLLAAYALKKIPIGKRILFTILLLPLTLQQASSYSYDNPLIVSAILVVALTLRWKYSEEKVKISEILLFLYAAFVLITVKSGLYAYLILFVVFVLVNKTCFTGKYKKWILGSIIALGILGIIWMIPLHGWDKIYDILTREFYQENSKTYGYSALYYMTHLGDLGQRLVNTFFEYGDDYILQMTGNGLGWLEVPNTLKARVFYIAMVLIAAIRTEKEKIQIDTQTRVFSALFGFAGIFLCMFAMLLFWTPANHFVIEGVQGRYFIPLLLPIFLGVGYWKKPVIKIDLDLYYPILLSGMGYVTALSVIRYNIQIM